jgi:hypothetical protein
MFDYQNLLKMAPPKENLPDRFPMSDSPCLPNMEPNRTRQTDRKVESYTGWWCNNHLEKYEFVNGFRITPYIMENKIHVWNHQTAIESGKSQVFIVDARAGIVSGEHNPDISPIQLVFFPFIAFYSWVMLRPRFSEYQEHSRTTFGFRP